jgi:hypothetical protein
MKSGCQAAAGPQAAVRPPSLTIVELAIQLIHACLTWRWHWQPDSEGRPEPEPERESVGPPVTLMPRRRPCHVPWQDVLCQQVTCVVTGTVNSPSHRDRGTVTAAAPGFRLVTAGRGATRAPLPCRAAGPCPGGMGT